MIDKQIECFRDAKIHGTVRDNGLQVSSRRRESVYSFAMLMYEMFQNPSKWQSVGQRQIKEVRRAVDEVRPNRLPGMKSREAEA